MHSTSTQQSARQHRLHRSLKAEGGQNFRAVLKKHHEHEKRHGPLRTARTAPAKKSLGIVGAGIAGMYTAHLLKEKYGDKFDITILESTDRVGGRILTHKFSDDPFQYGEFGAMRIPDFHDTVLKLFGKLGVKLVDFIFSTPNSLYYVNGTKKDENVMIKEYAEGHVEELGYMQIQIQSSRVIVLPVNPEDFDGITLLLKNDADHSKYKSVGSLYDSVYSHLADELDKNFETFFDTYDKFTVYDYFHLVIPNLLKQDCLDLPPKGKIEGLIDSILHYAEMTSSATGLNHLALVESVLDNRNFQADQKWHTAEGGMEHFTDALSKTLGDTTIHRNRRVIDLLPAADPKNPWKVKVTHVKSGSDTDQKVDWYDRVVVASPFGSTRYFISPDSQFTYGKKQAIRCLNYDHSTKIFAQFDKRWWETLDNKQHGGASITDLPVRTVVYPSYGLDQDVKGVLLCSYTWQNDAIMIANISDGDRKQVVKDSLSRLHNSDEPTKGEITLATHTWLEAFALFGPGQFNLMVNAMIPELGVHFAGEHLSTFHAWIIGALNSATRTVREILVLEEILTSEEAWKEFPDNEFTDATWAEYMNNVKPNTQ